MLDTSRSRVLLALFAVSLLAGCDDDRLPTCPPQVTGVIQGRVHDGGGPWPAEVLVESLGREDYAYVVTAECDSLGRFSLTAPVGPVRLQVNVDGGGRFYQGADGPVWSASEADTLVVGEHPLQLDIPLGRIAATVTLPANLTGQSVSLDGAPVVENQWVSFFTTREEADGPTPFALRMLPAGEYRLRVGISGQHVYLPPTLDLQAADRVPVVPLTEAECAFAVGPPARIAGRVSGSWQVLDQSRPLVEARPTTGDGITATADDLGRFAIETYVPGPYRLRVRIGGIPAWYGGPDAESATVFELESGQVVDGIEHVESGVLVDLETAGDIQVRRGSVRLWRDDGTWIYGNSGLTGNGSFAMSNLDAGTYFLELIPDIWGGDWLHQFYDGQDSLAAATPIAVAGGGTVTEITATLQAGGVIRGQLTDGDGDPPSLGWLDLRLFRAGENDESVARLREDRYDVLTGDYELRGLPDGDYHLVARLDDWYWLWYPGTPYQDQAQTITITDHALVDGIDFVVEFAKHR